MAKLGVNIDHVATLRNARGTLYPDPVEAAVLAQLGGADQITVHLREDRRHITDRDVAILCSVLQVPLNLEMANTPEMIQIALRTKPQMVTIVPEKRAERTTEGGLDVVGCFTEVKAAVQILQGAGIPVSLFVEPDSHVLGYCAESGAQMVELHTGKYAEEKGESAQRDLGRVAAACYFGLQNGLIVHSGHGLNYTNTQAIAGINGMGDLNIGHSIVARAVLVGFEKAVRQMKDLIDQAAFTAAMQAQVRN